MTTGVVERRKRLVDGAVAHPLLAVAGLATVLRLASVIVLGPFREGVAVPDEIQYLELAEAVASGRGAESWQPGYGRSLYDATASYLRPLAALTWLFGQHQLSGQLLSTFFGVITAVLVTWLALRVVPRPLALLTGVVAAALPSQVYWSSVVLRESMTWALLATLAVAVHLAAGEKRLRVLAGVGLLAFGALYALADVRQQTAVVAAWSLVLVALLVRSQRRLVLVAGALTVATLAPLATGLGPLGYTFVEGAAPALAVIRANLSLGAASSIVDTTPLPTEVPPGRVGGVDASPPPAVVTSADGQSFAVEDTSAVVPGDIPGALVAVALRPFPWEPAPNTGVLLAKIENAGWFVLYLIAAIGVAVAWRRRDTLAFPIVVTAGLFALAALTQGNLGTAFRHRGQTLWALVLLAAVGVQYLLDRRRARAA